MGAIVVVLFLIGALALWIAAGVHFYRGSELTKSFSHLGGCVGILFTLWFLMVAPTFGCAGFLCGLDGFLLFILLSYLIFLGWGMTLFFYSNKKYHDANNKGSSKGILDDEF